MKKSNLVFMALAALSLLAAPVMALEEGITMAGEAEITIGGVSVCAILSLIIVTIFGVALYMGFNLVKKLYGGRFTSALPYLLMAVALLFCMEVLCLFGDFYTAIGETTLFAHGIQMLQLVAGVFFISALYQIYQARFAMSGFMGGDE